MKRTVVIGMLGTTLDTGHGPARWDRWRPTVDMCRHEDLLVSRLELLHSAPHRKLATLVAGDVRRVSPETEVRTHLVEIADPWDLEEVFGALHDFARGYAFRPEEEEYLVHITTGTHVAQICMFLLVESRRIPARLLQAEPPPRYEAGANPGSYAIIDLDLSRYDRLASRFREEVREGASFLKSGIETRSPAFNRMIERIEEVALRSRAPLLLTGPTGAGKSRLARRVHELKRRRGLVKGELVEVNCATLRGDTAASTLFGHVKGAFTGATGDRAGLLRKADGGVLFLDEIGELGQDEQAMLLRALEERTFHPVGSDQEARSDFQLIAGTNRDLGRAVAAGRFREDLFARIDLWAFRLPPLAERREDIAPNLDYELERSGAALGARVEMNREARERFLAFAEDPRTPWHANFRDLNAAVVRMATLAAGGRIGVSHVDEEIARLRAAWASVEASEGGGAEGALAEVRRVLGAERAEALDRFDLVQLADVLRVCRGARSLSAAGRALFASSRARKASVNDADRLRKYLARFDVEWAAATG